MTIQTVENSEGCVWFMRDGKSFMYFDASGNMFVNGDVSAFITTTTIDTKFPPPRELKSKKITDYFGNLSNENN